MWDGANNVALAGLTIGPLYRARMVQMLGHFYHFNWRLYFLGIKPTCILHPSNGWIYFEDGTNFRHLYVAIWRFQIFGRLSKCAAFMMVPLLNLWRFDDASLLACIHRMESYFYMVCKIGESLRARSETVTRPLLFICSKNKLYMVNLTEPYHTDYIYKDTLYFVRR